MDFLAKQTETSETVNVAVITEEGEQTERNGQQLDDQDVDNFIVENRNKHTTKCFTNRRNLYKKQGLLKTYQQKLDKVLAHFLLKYTHSRQCYAVLTAYYENKENNTIYSPTDSLQRPEKLCLQNVSSFTVSKKDKSPIKLLFWPKLRFRCGTKATGLWNTAQSFAHRLVQQYPVLWLASRWRTSSSQVWRFPNQVRRRATRKRVRGMDNRAGEQDSHWRTRLCRWPFIQSKNVPYWRTTLPCSHL